MPPTKGQSELVLNSDGSTYHLSLLPKHISDRIITVGDPGRVLQIAQYFDKIEHEINKREFVTVTGWYKGKRLSVISTGIGADNMEIFFSELDALFNIDLKKREEKSRKKRLKVIRLGTSGAMQADIPLGSHIIANHAVGLDNVMAYYNLKFTDYEQKVALAFEMEVDLPNQPYVIKCDENLRTALTGDYQEGNTITAPGFYAPQGRSLRAPVKYPKLLDQIPFFHAHDFWISNMEMETAAFYAFARLLGHQAISINAVLANRIKNTFTKKPSRIIEDLIKKVLEDIHASGL